MSTPRPEHSARRSAQSTLVGTLQEEKGKNSCSHVVILCQLFLRTSLLVVDGHKAYRVQDSWDPHGYDLRDVT